MAISLLCGAKSNNSGGKHGTVIQISWDYFTSLWRCTFFKTIRIKIFILNVEVIFTKPIVLYIADIVMEKAV